MPGWMYDRTVQYQEKVDVLSTLPETTTITKWFVPPSQPTYRPQVRAHNHPYFSTPATAEVVSLAGKMDRWAFPPVLPRSRPTPPNTNAVFVFAPAAVETVTPDKWFSPAAQPTYRRGIGTALQLFFTVSPFALTQPESSTLDRWFSPASQPTYRRGTGTNLQPYFAISPFGLTQAESVTVDKWHREASQPTYRIRDAQPSSVTVPLNDVTADRWFYPSVMPHGKLPTLDTNYVLAYAPTPVEIVTADKWFAEPPGPVRSRTLSTALQQALAEALPLSPVTIDRWFAPPEMPIRLRIAGQDIYTVPPSGEVGLPGTSLPTPVGMPGKPVKIRRRYVQRWHNLARNARGRYEEVPEFYEIVAKAAKDERKPASEALAQVADEVIEMVRPFARSEAQIPGVASVNWQAIKADLDTYNRLMALYAFALMIEQGDEEDLLLAAMLAW